MTGAYGHGRDALAAVQEEIAAGGEIPSLPPVEQLVGEYVMPPRDAFLGTTKRVKLQKAAGEIAAEPVSPYPPGVPVLAPGERISAEALAYLTSGLEAGMLIPDAADPELSTLRVVAE